MAEVILRNITKSFDDHEVIRGLNLTVGNGEFVTLVGPSGCGKTTLLRMIAGLEGIDSGELRIGGTNCTTLPARQRNLAMVFQSYALFPHMSVRENILFGLRIRKMAAAEMEEKLRWALALLRLDGLDKRLPKEISGGQRQRVALARALVMDPRVLLLDEPLSNLDAALREMAMEELKRIHRQVGKTIIYVTHNQIEALTMSNRIAVLNQGGLEQYDRPKVVYDYPRTVFSATFIGSPTMNTFEGTVACRDGIMGAQTPFGFILLDKRRVEAAGTMIGKKVIVGIRPQHITCAGHSFSRRFSDTRIEITIELIEMMGDRSLVVGCNDQGAVVRFLITREDDIAPDQRVTVFFDGRRVHVFDPQSRHNLFPPEQVAQK